jgi:hypothetical protein
MNRLEHRLHRLEYRRLQADCERIAASVGLSGAVLLQELRRYLNNPDDTRMQTFEATLTEAERTELVALKAHWRRILGPG